MNTMRIIKIETLPETTFYCLAKKTRNGFMHQVYAVNRAVKTADGKNQVITARASYLNRTWERFEFETVIRNAIRKMDKNFLNTFDNRTAKLQQDGFIYDLACNKYSTQDLPDFKNYIKAGFENF